MARNRGRTCVDRTGTGMAGARTGMAGRRAGADVARARTGMARAGADVARNGTGMAGNGSWADVTRNRPRMAGNGSWTHVARNRPRMAGRRTGTDVARRRGHRSWSRRGHRSWSRRRRRPRRGCGPGRRRRSRRRFRRRRRLLLRLVCQAKRRGKNERRCRQYRNESLPFHIVASSRFFTCASKKCPGAWPCLSTGAPDGNIGQRPGLPSRALPRPGGGPSPTVTAASSDAHHGSLSLPIVSGVSFPVTPIFLSAWNFLTAAWVLGPFSRRVCRRNIPFPSTAAAPP